MPAPARGGTAKHQAALDGMYIVRVAPGALTEFAQADAIRK